MALTVIVQRTTWRFPPDWRFTRRTMVDTDPGSACPAAGCVQASAGESSVRQLRERQSSWGFEHCLDTPCLCERRIRNRPPAGTDRASQGALREGVEAGSVSSSEFSEAVHRIGDLFWLRARGTPVTGSRSFCASARYETTLPSALRRLVSRRYMCLHDTSLRRY
jgi:hypothetical protein